MDTPQEIQERIIREITESGDPFYQFENLLTKASQLEEMPEERKAADREITHLIGEDMPVIPVMIYAHDHVGSERIKEMFYDTQGKAHLYDCELNA